MSSRSRRRRSHLSFQSFSLFYQHCLQDNGTKRQHSTAKTLSIQREKAKTMLNQEAQTALQLSRCRSEYKSYQQLRSGMTPKMVGQVDPDVPLHTHQAASQRNERLHSASVHLPSRQATNECNSPSIAARLGRLNATLSSEHSGWRQCCGPLPARQSFFIRHQPPAKHVTANHDRGRVRTKTPDRPPS